MEPTLVIIEDCIDTALKTEGVLGAPCGYPVNYLTNQRDITKPKIRKCKFGFCCAVGTLIGFKDYEFCAPVNTGFATVEGNTWEIVCGAPEGALSLVIWL